MDDGKRSACVWGIATCDRPDLLRQTLGSLRTAAVWDPIIVSDDSALLADATRAVVHEFCAKYITGPRMGAFANRNHVIDAIRPLSPSVVALCDDDLRFDVNIGAVLRAQLETRSPPFVLCTAIYQRGEMLDVSQRSFWGFMDVSAVAGGAGPCSALSNAFFVASREVLTELAYDAGFPYGYGEADLGDRLRKAGVPMALVPELRAEHLVPGASVTTADAEAARIYFNLKRLCVIEGRPCLGCVFGVLDLPRGIIAHLRRGGVTAAGAFMVQWRRGVAAFVNKRGPSRRRGSLAR